MKDLLLFALLVLFASFSQACITISGVGKGHCTGNLALQENGYGWFKDCSASRHGPGTLTSWGSSTCANKGMVEITDSLGADYKVYVFDYNGSTDFATYFVADCLNSNCNSVISSSTWAEDVVYKSNTNVIVFVVCIDGTGTECDYKANFLFQDDELVCEDGSEPVINNLCCSTPSGNIFEDNICTCADGCPCNVCPSQAPVCGDGLCNGDENCETCNSDCSCVCGDEFCAPSFESCANCPSDCGQCGTSEGDCAQTSTCTVFCGTSPSSGVCYDISTESSPACPADIFDYCTSRGAPTFSMQCECTTTNNPTTTPTSGGGSSGGGGGCFFAQSVTKVLSTEGQIVEKSLSDLQVGDFVESVDEHFKQEFSRVYFIAHEDSTDLVPLVELNVASEENASIRLTPGHLLFAADVADISRMELSEAQSVVEGQFLCFFKDGVVSFAQVLKKSIFKGSIRHPLTENHRIVVDNIVASVHVFSDHAYRLATAPLRLASNFIPSILFSEYGKALLDAVVSGTDLIEEAINRE